MSLSYEQVRAFVTVAETGSFSAAARVLDRDRSTLSQVIANLEIDLGYGLFDRSAKLPVLTRDGQALLSHAKNLAEYTSSFESLSASIGKGIESELTIVHCDLIPKELITLSVQAIRAQFPDTNIHWLHRSREEIIAELEAGEADLGLGIAFKAKAISRMEYIHLANLHFIPVVGASHPLAKAGEREKVGITQLKEFRQLVPEDCITAEMQTTVVLSPHYQRIENMSVLKALLEINEGWAFLPKGLVHDELQQGVLVRLDVKELNQALAFPLSLWSFKSKNPTPVRQALIKRICEVMSELVGKYQQV
ncbi:LysR family transcriptional regulator [Shewanella eurypsychrophilus]|uniref:LysR family transcriptional regulator n=1 Tax=Shewanella eurypsychrophilus TaxID=2593656 RepID=A0ABX6V3G3_9GAMM|nr:MULTISPECIES: LysR family transcriptional regulator [Shewanella]QFU21225.1 LysR family transcriptional regulator [Shewanella sp. YLB-09]QPG56516.1 LysR family transcriptional regulator [Shewanella eurypsychrophilus]